MRFAVFVCLLATALLASASQQHHGQPFKQGHTYSYRFRTQVSSALLAEQPQMQQQQAATGMQALLKLTFTGDHSARVQLQHVRLGEMQGHVEGGQQKLIPTEMFEKRQLPEDVKEKLEQSFTIQLVDGVVQRLNFQDETESSWSKNIKRAAVNMLQLNLKRNDVQGLKMLSSQPQDDKEQQKQHVFVIPEITLEGECETTYSIQKRQPSRRWTEEGQSQEERENEQVQFNVTKTLNYNKCRRTSDIHYGFQVNPDQQIRCHKCLKQTEIKTNNVGKTEKQEELKLTLCQQECQTNQMNNNKNVERATVAQFELFGNQQKYAIRRSKVISQYVVKGQNPEAQNTISQVVSISELTLTQQEDGSEVPALKHTGKDEKLMYNPEWDLAEKRFYMYGDEEFDQKRNPFVNVQQKIQRAEKYVKEILEQWTQDKEMGYELTTAQTFNKFVQLIRQSTVQELKKIQERVMEVAKQVQGEEGHQVEHAKTLYLDALAVAGTRNALFELTHKVKQQQISTLKTAELIKIFTANQHSPSDRQVELLEQIAVSELAQRCPVLKQTAWLAYGQAIGKICQEQPAQSQKDHFRVEELCPEAKREQFKKTLIIQLKDASDIYEQILALKVIGNSALEKTLPELRKIITDKRQPTLIRMEAIDALRRLRTSQPEKIQQILLPIFQDQREQPEVRMATVSMILYTQPEKVILDQIVFAVQNDRSQNVKSFVLTILDSLSKSPSTAEQHIAEHLKAALKIVKITPEEMRASRKYRVPIYVSDQENTEEQNMFIGLASILSPSNMIPIHLATSIQAAFNGDAAREKIQLSFSQKDLEHLYEKLSNVYDRFTDSQQDNEEGQNAKDLRSIYSSLGIKSRRSGSYYLSSEEDEESSESTKRSSIMGKNTPFGMLVLRTNDVDQLIVPVDEQKMPQMIRKFLNGEKSSLEGFSELRTQLSAGKRFQQHIALIVGESKVKIPTSAGLPLAITFQTSIVASVQGKAQAELELGENKIRGELKLRQSAIATHEHKTEVWTPALVSGVKSLRTVELNHGEMKMKMSASTSKLEFSIEPPKQEQKERILGLHTLPATYVQKFQWESRTYGEPRLRTIRNFALEHQQYEFDHEQHRAIRVQGNVHRVQTLKQAINALYTTENNVHVYFKKNEHTPEIATLRISGFGFRRTEQGEHSNPDFQDFYQQSSQRKPFRSLYDDQDEEEEYKQMSFHSNKERESRLNGFVGKYQNNKAYKHQLKIELEARTPSKTHQAELAIQGTCDQRMQHCKAVLNVQRSPIWQHEQGTWEMQAKAQIVLPEIIRDEEEPTEKQSRLLIKSEAEWGPSSQRSSVVHVRVQGEPTRWRSDSGDKYARFLNKFDLTADYQLDRVQRHFVQRIYELLKYQLYWQLETQPERRGEDNTIRATFVVDPITRRNANLTIQTPTERVRAQSIELPSRIQGFSLERRPQQYQSFSHLIQSYSQSGSAECRADDRRVRTFDGVSYKAPLSSCWTVLAKDCSRESPRFVVLMKQTEEGEKKVKIITQRETIELQKQSGNQQIVVKINGEKVTDEERLQEFNIERTDYQVYVQQKGVSVRFDGVEAAIKVGSQYKNIQCGLCGHYSTEQNDVFRMSNNKRSQNLKDFHQSYVLKNEECNEKKLQKFYQDRDSEEFQMKPRKQQSAYYRDSFNQQQDSEEKQSEEQWWDSSEDKKSKNTKPVEQTQTLEYSQKICFSMKPVKKCPRGTVPADNQESQSVKVQFFCLERSSSEARRLLRQVRQGKQVNAEGQKPSFFDNVEQPIQCQQAEFY